jgi:hypothetical protein
MGKREDGLTRQSDLFPYFDVFVPAGKAAKDREE